MAFEKGKPRHPNAGRKKGTPHKKSLLVKEVLDNHGINLAEQIIVRLPRLSALEQVRALTQLLPYVYPKLTAIQHTGSITISDTELGDLANDELDNIIGEAARLTS